MGMWLAAAYEALGLVVVVVVVVRVWSVQVVAA
jgi:hypothetical protein